MEQLPELEPKFAKLRTWNWVLAFLHAAQGVAMLLLSTDFALPITTAFLKFDAATQSLQPTPAILTTLPIGPMVAAFLFLSAAAHLAVALNFRWYAAHILRGINPARWVEYALSSSLMLVVIALLVGVYDIAAVLPLFFLNMAMILFGWMMELHNQTTPRTNWLAFWFGTLSGAVPWIVIGLYLFGAGDAGTRAPDFVYWIYLSIFLFFNAFAVNMVLQYRKVGPWREYAYGERAYMVLSLVAKSLLAWQVFAGTLRPV